jgi:hypothetical protein
MHRRCQRKRQGSNAITPAKPSDRTIHLGILDEARTVKSYHRQVLAERSLCKDAMRIGEKQAEQSMVN